MNQAVGIRRLVARLEGSPGLPAMALAVLLILALLATSACSTVDHRLKEIRQRRYAIDQFNLGLDFERQGNPSRALEHYHKSLNAAPRPATYYHIGHVYLEREEYHEAKSFLEKAVEVNPEYDLARLELERVKLLLAEQEAAAAAAQAQSGTQESAQPSPGPAPSSMPHGLLSAPAEQPMPPLEEVQQKLFPRLYAAGSDADKQEERRLYSYVLSHKIAMPSAEYHRRKAEEYALRGLLDESIKEYRDTLEFDPQDMEARLGLARAYERAGRIKAAEEEFLRTVEMFPQSATAAFNTGNFYFRQGLYAPARDYFQKAVALQPDYRAALNNLAASQIKLGEHVQAQATLEHLLELDPRFLNAHLNLGILFDDHLDDPEKALYHYRRYLELGGADRERVEQWISNLEAKSKAR